MTAAAAAVAAHEYSLFSDPLHTDGSSAAEDSRDAALHEADDYGDFEGRQMLPHQPEYCGTTAVATMVLMR